MPGIQFLGYIVDKYGLRTNPEKTRAVLEYPAPKNLKQLRSFLGMVGWYSRFIPDLAKIRLPLTELTKKGVNWHWDISQQEAFDKLKSLLTQTPNLARPDPSKPFTLQTDASSFALGAVLTQIFDGEEHPIAYASRTLSKPERNYTVTEKECLGVIWAVEKFRGYLQGTEFTVITDHSSLLWLHNLKDPTGRLARWATSLQAHNMTIKHRKVALHKVPDALSRSLDEGNEIAAIGIDTYDTWYMNKIQEVQKQLATVSDYKLHNNILYRHKPNHSMDPLIKDLNAWKIVVPESERRKILYDVHNTPHSGHLGVKKTLERLSLLYYWPSMRKDVEVYIKHCKECQLYKVSQQAPPGLMGLRQVEGPWTNVASDIFGPLPASKGTGFRYILVFVDLFTKYVELRPLRKANAKSIAKAFDEAILFKWASPKYFITDNGTEHKNKLMKDKMSKLGIVHNMICPYHARANPAERINRTLKTMTAIFTGTQHKNWDVYLNEFQYAFNTVSNESTGYSPAFLNLGRNLRPIVTAKQALDNPPSPESLTPEAWADRLQRLPALCEMVVENLEKANKRQAKYFNKNRREVDYSVGDEVARRNHVLSSAAKNFAAKLAPPLKGPCHVVEKVSPVVYALKDKGKRKKINVHVEDFKSFYSSPDEQHTPEQEPAQQKKRRIAEATGQARSDQDQPAAKKRGRPKGSKKRPLNPIESDSHPERSHLIAPKTTRSGRKYA